MGACREVPAEEVVTYLNLTQGIVRDSSQILLFPLGTFPHDGSLAPGYHSSGGIQKPLGSSSHLAL